MRFHHNREVANSAMVRFTQPYAQLIMFLLGLIIGYLLSTSANRNYLSQFHITRSSDSSHDSNTPACMFSTSDDASLFPLPVGNMMRLPAPLKSLSLHTLIIVATHGIHYGNSFDNIRTDESLWSLEDYQKGNGQINAFIDHIEKGIELTSKDPHSLLLFSGGETRQEAGPINLGYSYWRIAEQMDWFGFKQTNDVRKRTDIETLSRDSMENLLYSICRFYELTGHYPNKIIVVGFEFKRHRFEQMHRAAIKYPSDHFEYVGIDHPHPDVARTGEMENSIKPFENDPYGCSESMIRKKNQRNPFARALFGSVQSCPQLAELLVYCGPQLFHAKLPWDGL